MTAIRSEPPTDNHPDASSYRLEDRVSKTSGRVAMTGIQAVVRVPLDQQRLDAKNGLNTAGLICGYRGSPVGGMDQAYEQDRSFLEPNNIRFISGVNEDLAATAIWGTQQTALEESAIFDGVTGLWYGKGPGVDRSGDVFRHANTSGVHPNGGVLAVAGDDPACKSSTIASASEWSLSDLAMPVLYPGSVQDVLDFGLLGYAMSRFSGAWVGMKLHTNVADAYSTVDLDLARFGLSPAQFLVDGRPFQHRQSNTLIAPMSLVLEEEMFGPRLEAAKAFHAAQDFDRTFGAISNTRSGGAAESDHGLVGIVCAGPVFGELREALTQLGFETDEDLASLGIRLYKPAMIWPLEPSSFYRFAEGLNEIIVIEEKRAFLETQIRDLLYQRWSQTETGTRPPKVLGKQDLDGAPLFAAHGALVAEDLGSPLRRQLSRYVPAQRFTRERIPVSAESSALDAQTRTAFFCSGCPHNRSTVLPDGSRGHGGIGCHTMSLNMDREVFGVTHMGGEGAQWVGMAPFVSDQHRFQNLGDGTLAHSGSLAIRQAVSAGTNITYKILYNGTVAMTGGQDAAGEISVPDLTHWLRAEGVAKTIVVTDDVTKYEGRQLKLLGKSIGGASFASNATVVDRDRLDKAQRELRDVSGVTALIYDQECAAELRRGRKRGILQTPTTRVMIDESICEGCGDCGDTSNCASVHPVQTPLGRKTQIHQESCNYDLTCLNGNCPAFITVEVDPDDATSRSANTRKTSVVPTSKVPAGVLPGDPAIPASGTVLLVGIGGTGVVTVNQILATAALLDGKYSTGLDQTGLAQKGGSVVSNLRITTEQGTASNRVGTGAADAFLVFDLLTALKNLDRCDPKRTKAVVSTGLIPTGNMAAGRADEQFPEIADFADTLSKHTLADQSVWIDATGIAKHVFASQPAANLLVVGLAYQKAMLPVTAKSLERAIELNGVAVEMNIEAFRLGRRLASDSKLLDTLSSQAAAANTAATKDTSPPQLSAQLSGLAELVAGSAQLQEILAWRLPQLEGYQDLAYAERYVAFVAKVAAAESDGSIAGATSDLSETVARHLFKLMCYKDEYEVARLALDSNMAERARSMFGPNAKIRYRLEPPTVKSAGLDRKVAIPELAGQKMFQGLLKGKRLRGHRLDPFGNSDERKLERSLISEYELLVDWLLVELSRESSAERFHKAVAVAELADQLRGFAEVKLANALRYRSAVEAAKATF